MKDTRKSYGANASGFGGYVKPANLKEDRADHRLAKHQSGKRKVVVRGRGGETLPGVFKSEHETLSWVAKRVRKGTVLQRCCSLMKQAST